MNAGIECAFVYTSGETRTNIKIIDETTRICTELNEAGPPASLADAQKLEQTLSRITGKGDVVIFSGSVPDGLPEDVYARLIFGAKKSGAKTVLDADGLALSEGLRADPDAVKPNVGELSRLTGRQVCTPEEVAEVVLETGLSRGRRVLVSRGADGAMMFRDDSVLIADPSKVPVVSTVGAGDAMTAAVAIGLLEDMSNEEILKKACAYAAATVMSEHFEHLTAETVGKLQADIRLRYFQ